MPVIQGIMWSNFWTNMRPSAFGADTYDQSTGLVLEAVFCVYLERVCFKQITCFITTVLSTDRLYQTDVGQGNQGKTLLSDKYLVGRNLCRLY